MEKIFPDWMLFFWNYDVAGNTLGEIALAVVVFFALLIGIKITRRIFVRKFSLVAERTVTKWDDAFVEVIQKISTFFFLFFALYVTVEFFLTFPPSLEKLIRAAFIVSFAYESIKVARAVLSFALLRSNVGKNKTSFHGVMLMINIGLWSIGALVVLDNLGFDITTLAASLGIGGIAIALAAQNILGDLFSSFTIYFDKPFEVGDFIIIGQHSGYVKKIGLKTTRIATLQGEELVVSNAELTSTRIQNFKRLRRRRVVFQIGVTYDTPAEKLENIPKMIEEIVGNVEHAELDRVHFHAFGDFSLGFEIVYYVDSQEYGDYMDVQQALNLAIVRAFEKEKIEFAFPTQTLYVKK